MMMMKIQKSKKVTMMTMMNRISIGGQKVMMMTMMNRGTSCCVSSLFVSGRQKAKSLGR
jgi:hypothetical protein